MVLPAELVDHIFSFLQKDIPALKACSKALPSYSRLAERYLYAHIELEQEVGNDILENPQLLVHLRTLEIRFSFSQSHKQMAISIMAIIPRMTNLILLSISAPNWEEEFVSVFGNILQQPSFQELRLSFIYGLPLSFLDNAKNIKQLTLSNCTANEKEAFSSLPSSQLSLETLVLIGDFNRNLHRWAMRWVTRLTTLELHYLSLRLDWTAFPELLVACSNSLTSLHLVMSNYYDEEIPFSLSALMHLKRLSISTVTKNVWSLPEIIRIINTAPAIQHVTLRFQFRSSIFVVQLNWSILDRLRSNLTGKRPCIDLWATCERRSGPECIIDDLAANETLMDFVKGGLVTLRSSRSVSEIPFY